MKPEEELFADFVNEYHKEEEIDIMLDPLLYIYYRDSIEFAAYKMRYHCDTLFMSTCKSFMIDKICRRLSKWIKSI